MSLIDNNLQTRSSHGSVEYFQNLNQNYIPINQTSYSGDFQIKNLLQAEGTEQNITSSSPTNDGKFI